MRTIIIDNEPEIISILSQMIEDLALPLDPCGTANGVREGVKLIESVEPELVFLDVEMDDGTGFDLLRDLEKRTFKLIFITAHNKYAIEAIRYSALDYLLKPLSKYEVKEAVERVMLTGKDEDRQQMTNLVENLGNDVPNKIVLKSAESIHIVAISSIISCEADGNYTTFYLKDQPKIIVSGTLKEYESLLGKRPFYRPHNSFLINLEEVVRYDKSEGGSIVMSDGSVVPVSTRKKEGFLTALTSLS